jgi:hypothetical protein
MVRAVREGSKDQRERAALIGRARALYDALLALPPDDVEHRRLVWAEIVDLQDQIAALMPATPDAR